MKSTLKQLKQRGFFNHELLIEYQTYSQAELLQVLEDPKPEVRTVGLRLLTNYEEKTIDAVLQLLIKEKALYTKIEACNYLCKGNTKTIDKMFCYIGKIGNNQYHSLPEKISKKKSYPLPRDIIVRCIGTMDYQVYPKLVEQLSSNDDDYVSEIIDAIGYFMFHHKEFATRKNYIQLKNRIVPRCDNELIYYRYILLLSNFKDAKQELKTIIEKTTGILQEEALKAYKK